MEDHKLRIRIFVAVVVAVLGILGGRLVQLQLIRGDAYWGESRDNAVRQRWVQPARGAIYDRSGELLVDNEPSYTIMLTPRYFDPSKVDLLAELVGVADTTVLRKLKEAREWSAFRPSRSFRELSFDTFSRVQEYRYMLPGVSYEIEQKRRYHTSANAAHALGYIREIDARELEDLRAESYRQGDRVGKSGVEKAYESILRGTPGSEFKLVNVRGLEVKPYRDGAEDEPPESGYDLHLSIDHEVQALAESLFVGKRGAVVALDPSNGEIISFVSQPDYNPNLFSEAVQEEAWDSLRTHPSKPLFNRASMSGKPPGSTWKPFMSLIALQEGLIGANTKVDCSAGYRFGRRTFRNHNNEDFGEIDVKEALEVSCNTFYYHLMMEMDVNTWHDWALKFGFGQRAPLDIGDQRPGLIPDSSYFNRVYGTGRWTAGYTINLGIGQGDMVVTPVQLARYTAALANKGTLHPLHLVKAIRHPETGQTIQPDLPPADEIPIEKRHFETVREGMRRVMENGTGQWVQIPDIPSAGKTGTAQNPHGKDHSLFIMFAPYDDPEIAIAVVVENAGYGASAAAPIASLMAEQYLTGGITDNWTRNFWMKKLVEEVRSAPLKGEDAPQPEPATPPSPAPDDDIAEAAESTEPAQTTESASSEAGASDLVPLESAPLESTTSESTTSESTSSGSSSESPSAESSSSESSD
jgi:penicillin-binding protein 2